LICIGLFLWCNQPCLTCIKAYLGYLFKLFSFMYIYGFSKLFSKINLSRRVSDADWLTYSALEAPAALCCAEVDVSLVLFERSRDSE
jgi:hypothetical protein